MNQLSNAEQELWNGIYYDAIDDGETEEDAREAAQTAVEYWRASRWGGDLSLDYGEAPEGERSTPGVGRRET